MLNSVDPLLHHLHRRGTGSWSYFNRAVENFDPSLDPASCARGLAEHALVEFDFSGARDWSVTSAQIVVANSGKAATWGGTGRGVGVDGGAVLADRRVLWFGRDAYSYEHACGIRGRASWPARMQVTVACDIRRYLPSVDAMIASRPIERWPERNAARLAIRAEERRNPDGGFRRTVLLAEWEDETRPIPEANGVWRLDKRTYLVCRNFRTFITDHEAALWFGFRRAADRLGVENLAIYDGRELHIARYPALPIPYVRAMLVDGVVEIKADRPERRRFANVSRQLVGWLSDQLGFDVCDVS